MATDEQVAKLGFNELLLVAVILLMLTGVAMGVGLYVLPRDPLQIAEVQPTVRVARASDFPVGASRVIHWGRRIIVVVRTGEGRYAALQGVSPHDGCILRWDAASLRLVSPCSYVVYDLNGNVVVGLSRTPLRQFTVFVRADFVYVAE